MSLCVLFVCVCVEGEGGFVGTYFREESCHTDRCEGIIEIERI